MVRVFWFLTAATVLLVCAALTLPACGPQGSGASGDAGNGVPDATTDALDGSSAEGSDASGADSSLADAPPDVVTLADSGTADSLPPPSSDAGLCSDGGWC
jgi:hypothetical protein